MVRGGGVIFGQDSSISESVALWGLSTAHHKGEEEAVESLAAEINEGQERREDREQCIMKREKGRKESGNLIHLGEKELYLSFFLSITFGCMNICRQIICLSSYVYLGIRKEGLFLLFGSIVSQKSKFRFLEKNLVLKVRPSTSQIWSFSFTGEYFKMCFFIWKTT